MRYWAVLGCLLAWALPSCGSGGNSAESCSTGSERCACYGNGTCDNGLSCLSNRCVNDSAPSAGQAGGGFGGVDADAGASGSDAGASGNDAGASGSDSDSANGGGDAASGAAHSGGTSGEGGGRPTAGASTHQGGNAGVGGKLASAGAGGTPASAGAGGHVGNAGNAGSGGSVGNAGSGGNGGSAGSAGGSGKPVFAELSLGAEHSCGRLTDGTVYCWGYNQGGMLGDGTTVNQYYPAKVIGLTGVVQIEVGGYNSCALMADQSVRCWTLGKAPTAVTGLSNVSAINCGRNSCCALLANKTLACWGANASGELGAGSSVIESATPLAVVGLTNALEVQVGDLHACARLENGAVYCWGDNYSGQVSGDTSVANSGIPLLMTGLPFANSLTAGGSHTCATVKKTDPSPVYGNTLCWGANGLNQSGSASFANFKEPSSHVRAHLLSAGHAHNCATDSLGVVYCWADNSSGQLGIGYKNQMDSGFPSPLSASPITQIALGDSHSCVLHQDGTAQCWGLHTAGQLGCGTNFSTTKPVPVYLSVN